MPLTALLEDAPASGRAGDDDFLRAGAAGAQHDGAAHELPGLIHGHHDRSRYRRPLTFERTLIIIISLFHYIAKMK
jgi:hypothetical protein